MSSTSTTGSIASIFMTTMFVMALSCTAEAFMVRSLTSANERTGRRTTKNHNKQRQSTKQPSPKLVKSSTMKATSTGSAASSTAFFNGGKMQHIFIFNTETRKYETSGAFFSPEAQEALLHGILYYKIDGSNGMVQVVRTEDNGNDPEDVTLKLYQRMDTRGKNPKEDLIPLPNGKNDSEYAGHSYYYSQIVTENVQGKRLIKRNRAMMELVERHRDKFVALQREWISVEWVGTMFNKTPQVPHSIALAIHQEQLVEVEDSNNIGIRNDNHHDQHEKGNAGTENTPENGNDNIPTATMGIEGETKATVNDNAPQPTTPTIERTYEGMRKYLLEDCAEQPIEGLIVEHQGVYWKVRSDCFLLPKGTDDPFKKNRDNSRPPVFLV